MPKRTPKPVPASPQKNYRFNVFISYSHENRKWVQVTLLPLLEQAGLSVCIDYRDFEIGRPSIVNMEWAVENSRHTLIVLTPNWIESQWADFESLLVATSDPAGRTSRLLPLMLRPCEPPPRIAILTYADLTEPGSRQGQLNKLLDQLRRQTDPQPAPREDDTPFTAGLPITHPSMFFGRERELKRLFGLLSHRPLQNALIVGPRRSGKTSLLLYLQNLLMNPDQGLAAERTAPPIGYRCVLVDFQDLRLGTRRGLLHYLLDRLQFPASEPCELERFLDIVAQRLRTPTVILMDEIGVALQRYPELDDPFWESLRSLVTTQTGGNLAFLLAAPESPIELAYHSGRSSPFFNIFGYTATLGPLTEVEARALLASSPFPFPDDDVEWILTQSRRWPILLQILGRERFLTIKEGETGQAWREDGLRQIVMFRQLLENA